MIITPTHKAKHCEHIVSLKASGTAVAITSILQSRELKYREVNYFVQGKSGFMGKPVEGCDITQHCFLGFILTHTSISLYAVLEGDPICWMPLLKTLGIIVLFKF